MLSVLLCTIAPMPSFARPDPFAEFQQQASHICPEHRLDYLVDGNWIDIMLDGKGAIFRKSAETKLIRSERHFSKSMHCDERLTVHCSVAARFLAIQSQGLMKQFVQQICKSWRCEEEADCSYTTEGSHLRN
jgi:hypothetical protein